MWLSVCMLTCFDVGVSVCPVENCQLHQLHLLQVILALRLQNTHKFKYITVIHNNRPHAYYIQTEVFLNAKSHNLHDVHLPL